MLKGLILVKKNIFKFLSPQLIAMKVNESITKNHILSYTHYAPLFGQANFKTENAHFSKLCLLKAVILVKK